LSGDGDTNRDEGRQGKEASVVADRNGILEPKAKEEMERLKLEVADETLGRDLDTKITAENYEEALDRKKWEAAAELGMKDKIEDVGWENMTTREVGKIGGQVGGKIGGQMVKELIGMAEAQMAPVAEEATDKQAIAASTKDG
jgi:hypothetical protein